jgi:hypothetical protein
MAANARKKRGTFMSPEQFRTIAQDLFGGSRQTKLGLALGRSRTTIFRYENGTEPIPSYVALCVILMAERKNIIGDKLPELREVGVVDGLEFVPFEPVQADLEMVRKLTGIQDLAA